MARSMRKPFIGRSNEFRKDWMYAKMEMVFGLCFGIYGIALNVKYLSLNLPGKTGDPIVIEKM